MHQLVVPLTNIHIFKDFLALGFLYSLLKACNAEDKIYAILFKITSLHIFLSFGSYIELFIVDRSSIRVMCGRGQYGLWACIPDYQAGCELNYLNDVFFNTECFARAMKNKIDAVTVAEALKLLADKNIF